MGQIKPLVLNLTTAKEQAEYYFNREFQSVHIDLLKDEHQGLQVEVEYPSDVVILSEYLGISGKSGMLEDYKNEKDESFDSDNWREDEGFIEYASNSNDFEEYKYGDFMQDHYPMWNWVFACSDFYISSDYMDIDKLYSCGIGVLKDVQGNYYLFISGAGYDFYEAHWIPLFKQLGWIKEE